MENEFPPANIENMRSRDWDRVDFCLVTGDAYVDHPSFGSAIICRVLESEGFRVGILAQPDWRSKQSFQEFGRPRLGFLVTAGNLDSMVNHYTAAKKPRSGDAYSPGGKSGLRPDRATIVYVNKIREAYARMPIVIGGVEASLRRFAHYDYWSDKVRRSILVDSGANLLVYGMGETAILEIGHAMDAGIPIGEITYVRGTCFLTEEPPAEAAVLPSFEEVCRDKTLYAKAHSLMEREQDAIRGKALAQNHAGVWLVQNPPAYPLGAKRLDEIYALPYARRPHPAYKESIPALQEVEFSITSSRGCFGGCSFCALTMHQGRVVQCRSHGSIVREAAVMTKSPGFKGYIHDVGGPTANFRFPACKKQLKEGTCAHRDCLFPNICRNADVSHSDYMALLKKIRELPGIKKVFIRSGIRMDYLLADRDKSVLREICQHHVSGQLKVAPEHIAPSVLDAMHKPDSEVYERFRKRYQSINVSLGKEQFCVPYFMSSHPGSDINAAIELARYLQKTNQRVEQVQDFYPTPGTRSTCMFYTGIDPVTMRAVYVPKTRDEKAAQRALLQPYKRENRPLIRKALRAAGREDLIGSGKDCLVRDQGSDSPSGASRHLPPRGRHS